MIVLVTPPRGAVKENHAPVPALTKPPQTTATDDLVQLTRWWTVPRPPDRVYAAFDRSGLPTLQQQGNGSATADGATTFRYLLFTAQPRPGLDSEQVLVTVASDGHGGAAVRADAQVVWRPARPPEEAILDDADQVEVSAYVGNAADGLLARKTLTGQAARRLIRTVNGLPTAARTEHSCAPDFGYTLRVAAGPLVFLDNVACNAIVVTRAGRSLPVLAGDGRFTRLVASSLGLPERYQPTAQPSPRDN